MNNPFTITLTFTSDEEREFLKQEAKALGLSVNAYVWHLVISRAKAEDKTPPERIDKRGKR